MAVVTWPFYIGRFTFYIEIDPVGRRPTLPFFQQPPVPRLSEKLDSERGPVGQ